MKVPFSQVPMVHHPRHTTTPGVGPLECRKDSVSPPPDRDLSPSLPHIIFDPVLKCKYRIGEYLGKGGFAWCYEAIDDFGNKIYALKVIPKFRLTKPHHRSKVLREITIHQQLRHEHIVRMYSSFEDEDNMYMVLEYCQLKSLVNVLRNRRYLTETEARVYLRQLLLSVNHLHTNSAVLHRDLKLGNMLLTSDMKIKLADFGLATYMRSSNDHPNSISICGTPNYISPEVLNKQGHSIGTESWAIGCILYALLFGRPPFETAQLEETYQLIRVCQYNLPFSISANARDLISKLLHPDPRFRPAAKRALQHPFFTEATEMCRLHTDHCYRPPNSNEIVQRVFWSQPSDDYNRGRVTPIPQDTQHQYISNDVYSVPNSGPPPTPSSSGSTPPSRGGSTSPSSPSGADSGLGASAQTQNHTNRLSSMNLCDLFRFYHDMLVMEKKGRHVSPFAREIGLHPLSDGTPVLYVTKWIDYTNKYGFGCQLSDGTVSVAFLDNSYMSFSKEHRSYQYLASSTCAQSPCTWSADDLAPTELHDKVSLMTMFQQYMDQNLIQGGDAQGQRFDFKNTTIPTLVHWKRPDNSVVMMLSDGTFQINNFDSHTKVVLSLSHDGSSINVTFIDSNRHARSFVLDLRKYTRSQVNQFHSDAFYSLLDQALVLLKLELRSLVHPNPNVWITDC